MTFQSTRSSQSLPLNDAARKINQLQSDIVSSARMWAVDEMGAAIAHQLNEPLTALLLYLHEMRDHGERSSQTEMSSDSMGEMVTLALRATERVCEILDRMGQTFVIPTSDDAMARGREAINSWISSTSMNVEVGASPTIAPSIYVSKHPLLTHREREVLTLITSGTSNKEGGHRLGISKRTFEVHRAHIMAKLGARNAADLVRKALNA